MRTTPVESTPTDQLALTDRQLQRLVAFNVHADSSLIEDACQTAWLRLTRSGLALTPVVRLAWLTTTATREALRLVRGRQSEISLDAPEAWQLASQAPGPDSVVEQRGRLAAVRDLTERQRRLIWLQGLGFSYREMAERENATLRTVERQVLRARGRLRAVSEIG